MITPKTWMTKGAGRRRNCSTRVARTHFIPRPSSFEGDDRPAEADGPAPRATREEEALQTVRRVRLLGLPRRAAVRRAVDGAARADRPPAPRVRERHGVEARRRLARLRRRLRRRRRRTRR